MVDLLAPSLRRGQRGGQPKLSLEDQLLMTLEYGGFCTTPQKGIVHNETFETHLIGILANC